MACEWKVTRVRRSTSATVHLERLGLPASWGPLEQLARPVRLGRKVRWGLRARRGRAVMSVHKARLVQREQLARWVRKARWDLRGQPERLAPRVFLESLVRGVT